MDNMQTGLRFGRRKTDDTFRAFHIACDEGDLARADGLLIILEDKFSFHAVPAAAQGNNRQALLQAQARLWSLRLRDFRDVEEALAVPEAVLTLERPTTSKLSAWLAAWLRGPRSRFAKAAEFLIKG